MVFLYDRRHAWSFLFGNGDHGKYGKFGKLGILFFNLKTKPVFTCKHLSCIYEPLQIPAS